MITGTFSETKEAIKKLLFNGELDKALQLFYEEYEKLGPNRILNEVIIFNNKLLRVKSDELKGIITRDASNVEKDKITKKFLSILDSLPFYIMGNAPFSQISGELRKIIENDIDFTEMEPATIATLNGIIKIWNSKDPDLVGFLNCIDRLTITFEDTKALRNALTIALGYGQFLRNEHDPQLAIPVFQAALKLINQLGNPALEWRIHQMIATIWVEKEQERLAFQSYENAMDVIDRMWFALLEENKLRNFFQDKAELYEQTSLCCLRLGYHKKAFEVLEKAKTRYLGDLIARRQMAPNRVLSKEIREYWEQTGMAKAVVASSGQARNANPNIISKLSKGKIPKGTAVYLPMKQWAFNKSVEDEETGQTQTLKTIVDTVWELVGFLDEDPADLPSENILKIKENLDAIYQVIAGALEETKDKSGFQDYENAAKSLRGWATEHKNSSLWVFQEYIETFKRVIFTRVENANNTSFELFLKAILEALDFHLKYHPVQIEFTGQYSQEDSDGWTYVFHKEGNGSEKTLSTLEEILLPLWQKRSSSSWRYIDQLARGESITFREAQNMLDGQTETAMIAYQVTSHGTVIYIFLGQNAIVGNDNLFPNLEGRDHFFIYTRSTVTESHLEELLFGENGWVKLQKNESQNWEESMDEALGWLYNELIAPIISFLKIKKIKHLRIIPHRHLHLVPFAALWYKEKEEKRYLIDDYDIAYLPSATLVNIALKRAATKDYSETLTTVTNPTGDLHFAKVEVDYLLRRYFGWNQKDLRGKNATRKEVEALELGHLFHFSGHASYNWKDPLASHLDLSDDKLELGCLFDEVLLTKHLHMAVLSACETGVTDPKSLSDEYLGLGSGFLFAGASTILSTLWPVSDKSTALLMRQFYESFKFSDFSPAQALQKAQQWLKDSTTKKQEASLRNLGYKRGIGIQDSSEFLPPSHPYFWAGFKLLGGK